MIKLKDLLNEIDVVDNELHLFDFDGTLFRSPMPPKDYKGKKGEWWRDWKSLSPPIVPEIPSDKWWNKKLVNQAKRSISNPRVYSVLATGRLDDKFRWRVPELLKHVGLNFDAVYMKPGGKTLDFKSKLIDRYLKKYPFLDKVIIWDDRTHHLGEFDKMLQKKGIDYEIVPVNIKPVKAYTDN